MSSPVDGDVAATAKPAFLRLVSGAGMLTSARVAGDLASALLFIAVSRVFGVEGTGLYAYAFAIAQIAQLVLNFGFVDYGLREYARAAAPVRQRILANALAVQCSLLVVVAAGIWAYLLTTGADPRTSTLIWLLAAYQVLFNFFLMLVIPAITAQRMAAPALAELVFRVGGTFVAIGLISFAGLGMAASLAALPLSALGLLLAAIGIARHFNGPIGLRLERAVVAPMLRPAASFAASSILIGLYAKIGLILLAFLDGKAAAGIFATGLKLVDLGMAPLVFLGVAVFPRLASSFGTDQADLVDITQQYVRLTIMLGALVLWGMVFVVPPVLPFLLGPDFAAAGPAVQLMGWVALLAALDNAAVRLLWVANLQAKRLRIQAIGLAVNVALNLALIPLLGVTGAIFAAILTLVVMLGLALGPITTSLPSPHWRRLGRACILPLAATIAAGFIVSLLGLQPWLAASVTLAVLLATTTLSGLSGLDQLKLPKR